MNARNAKQAAYQIAADLVESACLVDLDAGLDAATPADADKVIHSLRKIGDALQDRADALARPVARRRGRPL